MAAVVLALAQVFPAGQAVHPVDTTKLVASEYFPAGQGFA